MSKKIFLVTVPSGWEECDMLKLKEDFQQAVNDEGGVIVTQQGVSVEIVELEDAAF